MGYRYQSAPKFVTFESPQALRASVPTPIGPSGHFPLIGGIGPLCPRGAFVASEILSCYKFRGKDPRKPKRFSWSVQGGSGGKSKSPRARFLFATFSFGEAKEKVVPQLQISNMSSCIAKCIVNHKSSARAMPGRCWFYFAYSTAFVSRMTLTLIWPGYSSSDSIFLARARARRIILSSVTSSGLTITRTSRPA